MRREGAPWDRPSRTLTLKQTRRDERSVRSMNLWFVREILGIQSVMNCESGSCNSDPARRRGCKGGPRSQASRALEGAHPDRVSAGRSFATHYPSLHRASQCGELPLRIKHGHLASKRTDPTPRADICQWLRPNRILLNPTARRLGLTLSFSTFGDLINDIHCPEVE